MKNWRASDGGRQRDLKAVKGKLCVQPRPSGQLRSSPRHVFHLHICLFTIPNCHVVPDHHIYNQLLYSKNIPQFPAHALHMCVLCGRNKNLKSAYHGTLSSECCAAQRLESQSRLFVADRCVSCHFKIESTEQPTIFEVHGTNKVRSRKASLK